MLLGVPGRSLQDEQDIKREYRLNHGTREAAEIESAGHVQARGYHKGPHWTQIIRSRIIRGHCSSGATEQIQGLNHVRNTGELWEQEAAEAISPNKIAL